jgi:hypothetical protein
MRLTTNSITGVRHICLVELLDDHDLYLTVAAGDG